MLKRNNVKCLVTRNARNKSMVLSKVQGNLKRFRIKDKTFIKTKFVSLL